MFYVFHQNICPCNDNITVDEGKLTSTFFLISKQCKFTTKFYGYMNPDQLCEKLINMNYQASWKMNLNNVQLIGCFSLCISRFNVVLLFHLLYYSFLDITICFERCLKFVSCKICLALTEMIFFVSTITDMFKKWKWMAVAGTNGLYWCSQKRSDFSFNIVTIIA